MPRPDAEHRGPLINIAAWFLLVTTILFTASKVVTKWRMVRRLQNDDFILVTALVSFDSFDSSRAEIAGTVQLIL